MLEGIEILEGLSSEEIKSLEVFCQERMLSTGEILFSEGDEANSMYLLSKGKIEVFTNRNNKEVILGYIKSEEILGEMALFGEKSKRMASAKAVEDSRLIVLLEFSIQQLAEKHPEILDKIKEIIKKREEKNKKLI